MESLLDKLPAEIGKRINPQWRKNEADYWAKRPSLLADYTNKWIGFANGKVIACGTSAVEIFHVAQATGQHPFVTCVGHEHEPNRMRRLSFSYDTGYAIEPLPVMSAEFRKSVSIAGIALDHVIPDTGADASAIPWSDCERLQLDPAEGMPGLMGGVGESSMATVIFQAWVYLDGKNYPCRLQADLI